MGKKLVGNGIIESSRMILTEHRDAYLEHMNQLNRREKPTLDNQEVQMIERAIVDSFNRRCVIELTLFDPFEDEKISGVVSSFNTSTREVRLLLGEDYRWIKISEILSADCPNLY
ncbi:YolD-like protein [compost metagenome]